MKKNGETESMTIVMFSFIHHHLIHKVACGTPSPTSFVVASVLVRPAA